MMEYYQKIYKVTMEIRLMEMLLEEKNDMKSDIGDIVLSEEIKQRWK